MDSPLFYIPCLWLRRVHFRLQRRFYCFEIQPIFGAVIFDLRQRIGHWRAHYLFDDFLTHAPVQNFLEGGFAFDEFFSGCFARDRA